MRTDFKLRYHGTLGGFLWTLLKPIAMFGVLLSVFSFIFAARDYPLRLVLGLFLYNFFDEGTRSGIVALHRKGHLLTKTRFPRSVVVVTAAANALVTVVVASSAILVFLAVTHGVPSVGRVLLFVGYLVLCLLIIIGISLGLSALFLRYRDLNQVWEVVLQAGFFVAPIVYPLDILPERLHVFLYLWPPTAIVEFSRAVLLGDGFPTLKAHALLLLMTAVILGAGIISFRRFAPRAVEHL